MVRYLLTLVFFYGQLLNYRTAWCRYGWNGNPAYFFSFLFLVLCRQLCDYVAGEVTAYKRLTGGLKFVDAIPKSPSGKILRKDLVSTFDE